MGLFPLFRSCFADASLGPYIPPGDHYGQLTDICSGSKVIRYNFLKVLMLSGRKNGQTTEVLTRCKECQNAHNNNLSVFDPDTGGGQQC